MAQSLYSLGKNGPTQHRLKQPKKFTVAPIIGASKPINQFSTNGLFRATNIAGRSGHSAVTQLSRDININK